MTKRIFKSICLVALCVFIASVTLFMGMLYDYFSSAQKRQLKTQTLLAAQGVEHEGEKYFEDLTAKDFRITWIDKNGEVLYDNEVSSSEMENHLEREEIKQAFSEGMGESTRYSVTLAQESLYCAKKLSDGTVLRLCVSQNSVITLIMGMLPAILMIFVIALALSLVLASRLSKKIVKPLNNLNLEDPLSNDNYDELAPLLRRINAQQEQIKQQSDTLARRQREFETITNGMAEGIVLLNAKREILSINPAAQKLLGAEEPPIGEAVIEVNRSIELQEVLDIAYNGQHTEKTVQLYGGKYEISASPIISDKTVGGAALLFLDVTEKEKAQQIRQEFTANVSHELKTPLQTISGCAELMANGIAKPEDTVKFAAQIYSQSRCMIRLVDDIIKLSHLDEGVGDMKYENADLYAIAGEEIQSLAPIAEADGITLSLQGEPAFVKGIPQLLHAIVHNLCDNAVKYNRKGGSVNISVTNEENGVRFCVSDTGIGIPEESIPRIFERFYRVDKSHSKDNSLPQTNKNTSDYLRSSDLSGTGLGLSIVKHAAMMHNARIEVQSGINKGTEITVIFPL